MTPMTKVQQDAFRSFVCDLCQWPSTLYYLGLKEIATYALKRPVEGHWRDMSQEDARTTMRWVQANRLTPLAEIEGYQDDEIQNEETTSQQVVSSSSTEVLDHEHSTVHTLFGDIPKPAAKRKGSRRKNP